MQEFRFAPSVPKNDPLFDSYKDSFLSAKENLGEEKAYKFMRELFESRLKPAYDSMGFERGNPHDFIRCVGERDQSVGLEVVLYLSEDEKTIRYIFKTDPFSNLRNMVDPLRFYSTFMDFKVEYLLGPDWYYEITKHHHLGHESTEFVIAREHDAVLTIGMEEAVVAHIA